MSGAKRLRQLEPENTRLKQLLAEAHLDNAALKDLLSKKLLRPAARRRALRHLVEAHPRSERRACGLVGLARSVARYRPRRDDDAELRARLYELAGQHRRFAYLRLHALLRREGVMIHRKKTYRLYKAEDLAVRRCRRRRPPERKRLLLGVVPTRRNQRWSLDFASDALWTGRRFRCLCLVDDGTRESPALLTDISIAWQAGCALARRARLPARSAGGDRRGQRPQVHRPRAVRWSARTGVRLRFIQPDKPVQNAFVKSFIGCFRDECLNQDRFGSLAEAARINEAWRQHYNRERPQSAPGYEPPERFARRLGALGLDEGPRRSPALAPAPNPCYNVNRSPSSWT